MTKFFGFIFAALMLLAPVAPASANAFAYSTIACKARTNVNDTYKCTKPRKEDGPSTLGEYIGRDNFETARQLNRWPASYNRSTPFPQDLAGKVWIIKARRDQLASR